MEIITLDGSQGEGGGQILRTALSFSMLTGKPFRMTNIRKSRPEPGLKPQHLSAVQFILRNSSSKAIGAELGSSEISFFPGEWKGIIQNADIGTAGSITLFLQSVLIPLMFGRKCSFSIKGGTDVAWSIPVSAFSDCALPFFRKYARIDFRLIKRGYYPKGGGVVEISISPKIRLCDFSNFSEFITEARNLGKINLSERGSLVAIRGESHASTDLQSASVSEQARDAAVLELKQAGCPVQVASSYSSSESTGFGISLCALYSQKGSLEFNVNEPIILGSDVLGEKGMSAEKMGLDAAHSLLFSMSGAACADSMLADQLIPLLALFGGSMKAEKITNHLKSNIDVAEAFLGKRFTIDEKEGTVTAL
jgi:RNA 3'-phosphate cyclase